MEGRHYQGETQGLVLHRKSSEIIILLIRVHLGQVCHRQGEGNPTARLAFKPTQKRLTGMHVLLEKHTHTHTGHD